MLKQKIQKTSLIRVYPRAAIFAVAALLILGIALSPLATADRFQDQINELNAQNGQSTAQKKVLVVEADSLASTIAVLQAQISALEAQIRSNQDKMTELLGQIAAAEAELLKQKNLLGQNIKAMYLEGQISTLEMLASSKDLSEFVDKEQYRDSVKTKIKKTLDRINILKAELKKQKEELETRINEQKSMQTLLSVQRAENDRLLNLNEAQRYALDTQIKGNNSKISELRRQQAIENARFIGTAGTGVACGGGYPGSAGSQWGTWGCNYSLDNTIDNWGMYNRECVSYTAFKVAASGRNMPYWGGYGNANQWDDNARNSGIPVDGNPRPGDVAVSNAGYYGHVMYVEHVYGDGRILISQYNASWTGTYSEAVIWPNGLLFIHFP